jgi:putative Holliday junction resolvase
MARLIGIDYGTKRIGLAIGDRSTRIAMPWKIVQATGDPKTDAANVLKQIIDSGEKIELFVVGLPKNMDDTEGPQADITRTFGDVLKNISGADVYYQDERLSSFAAESLFKPTMQDRLRSQRKNIKSPKNKKTLDAVAAAVILQTFLEK